MSVKHTYEGAFLLCTSISVLEVCTVQLHYLGTCNTIIGLGLGISRYSILNDSNQDQTKKLYQDIPIYKYQELKQAVSKIFQPSQPHGPVSAM